MPQAKTPLPMIPGALRRYGLALLSSLVALGIAHFLDSIKFEGVEFPVFLIAVALTVWYAGTGPAIFVLLFSSLAFNYYFTEPKYSFYVTRTDLPYYVVFVLFAALITWFAALRRRVEQDLVRSRDELQQEVAIRTRQASLLDLTHDTIFVREMNDIVTYWNRGAQEMYGWTPDQAIGKRSHDLLRTVFPAKTEDPADGAAPCNAELLRTGRWEGELTHTRANGTEVVVSSRWSLQRSEHGNPIAILETNNDITQRKRGEEEVRTLNQELGKRTVELEAINKELEAFAYSISHDLRAPLRHMVGFTELLQKNSAASVDDKGRRYMMMILEAAKRMGVLIDDLLAFSRIGRAETRDIPTLARSNWNSSAPPTN